MEGCLFASAFKLEPWDVTGEAVDGDGVGEGTVGRGEFILGGVGGGAEEARDEGGGGTDKPGGGGGGGGGGSIGPREEPCCWKSRLGVKGN